MPAKNGGTKPYVGMHICKVDRFWLRALLLGIPSENMIFKASVLPRLSTLLPYCTIPYLTNARTHLKGTVDLKAEVGRHTKSRLLPIEASRTIDKGFLRIESVKYMKCAAYLYT
jgi:hypothetical protein